MNAAIRQLFSVSFPLALNRILMCVLQAGEAALLPQMLQRSGLSPVEALTFYGTLTGMALPMIFFPTAATSALGMLLLPAVSEAQALHHQKRIVNTVNASFLGGLLPGSFFLGVFLLFGEKIGTVVFHSELAGIYIRQLALVCPLIYISTTLMSILHALDQTAFLLLWNLFGFALRFFGIPRLVPKYGMTGYLFGLLADQLLVSVCILYSLHRLNLLTISISDSVTKASLPVLFSGAASFAFSSLTAEKIPALASLLLGGVTYCILFFITTILLLTPYTRFSLRRLFSDRTGSSGRPTL